MEVAMGWTYGTKRGNKNWKCNTKVDLREMGCEILLS
jgi:hypothetical protein